MLPPTSTAANYQFKGFPSGAVWKGNSLNAEECGWKISDGRMVPINTNKDLAPSVPSQTWQVHLQVWMWDSALWMHMSGFGIFCHLFGMQGCL